MPAFAVQFNAWRPVPELRVDVVGKAGGWLQYVRVGRDRALEKHLLFSLGAEFEHLGRRDDQVSLDKLIINIIIRNIYIKAGTVWTMSNGGGL